MKINKFLGFFSSFCVLFRYSYHQRKKMSSGDAFLENIPPKFQAILMQDPAWEKDPIRAVARLLVLGKLLPTAVLAFPAPYPWSASIWAQGLNTYYMIRDEMDILYFASWWSAGNIDLPPRTNTMDFQRAYKR
jgi:hypothetical protein